MKEQHSWDLGIIRARVESDLFSSPPVVFKDDACKICDISAYEALTAAYGDGTYYFTDLNYAPENRTEWGATISAYRLINLLKLGRAVGGAREESTIALALGHLRGFRARQYTNLNWWHLCIGLPQTVVRLLMMLGDRLDRDLYLYLLSLVERGSISKHPEVIEQHEGANLVWFCDTSIIHALLTEDAEELALASSLIGKETYGRADAGLQPDGSFFQHGRLLYSLGYGRSYVITIAPLIYYLGGTSFSLSSEALENVFSHVLDGVRHMTYRRGFDYLTMGREYVRLDTTDTESVRVAVSYLARLTDQPRAEEMSAFYRALCENTAPLTANKYFAVCRFLAHQDEHLYVGFRALDDTVLGTEVCNEENLLGIHLSYGTNTCVMRTGEEYRNIAPILRYDYMPGTTCAEETDAEMEARFVLPSRNLVSHKPRVLLCTGGNYGDLSVSHFRFERDGISQSATCIATPHSAILLGSGSHDGTRALHTTLEQCNALGAVKVSADGRRVTHNGVCYISYGDTPLISSVEHRVGSWKRNSRLSADTPHEGEVFTLYTPHTGKEFFYAYEIISEECAHLASFVLQNDAAYQCVRLPDGREVCVCLADGEISVK